MMEIYLIYIFIFPDDFIFIYTRMILIITVLSDNNIFDRNCAWNWSPVYIFPIENSVNFLCIRLSYKFVWRDDVYLTYFVWIFGAHPILWNYWMNWIMIWNELYMFWWWIICFIPVSYRGIMMIMMIMIMLIMFMMIMIFLY